MGQQGGVRWVARFAAFLGVMLLLSPTAKAVDDKTIALMRDGGNLLLIRHAATVPGVGDPPEFRVDDCSTQRNLSESGRNDARAIGAFLREAGVPVAEVRSSAWCRCVDTAKLAFDDWAPVDVWSPLNSFFAGQGDREAQTRDALAGLRGLPAASNWVWVTHQVNITAMTGVFLAMGEVLVERPAGSGVEVLARWKL